MSTVVVSTYNVVNSPQVGGHFWVYMQYVQGLRLLGCDVYWLERFKRTSDDRRDGERLRRFLDQMRRFGLEGRVLLYDQPAGDPGAFEFLTASPGEAGAIFRRADLVLNFHYAVSPELLKRFRRTAFVDIDPGLLQFWVAHGQIRLTPHQYSFTIGETVGRADARFPDCGLDWIHIRPAVCLEWWPFAEVPDTGRFTTVSNWWGGEGRGEFITDGKGLLYENNKRYSFLRFVDLPRLTPSELELALFLGDDETPFDESKRCLGREVGPVDPTYDGIEMYRYTGDHVDRRILEEYGWHVRPSHEVASTPEDYQRYVAGSRGEFSCAKPSCMRFQNAWISDRSLCYLASGRPVVLQDTGPSAFLPNGPGMYRFTTAEEAVEALERVNAEYERHRRAAREIAEAYFDAKQTAETILNAVSVRRASVVVAGPQPDPGARRAAAGPP